MRRDAYVPYTKLLFPCLFLSQYIGKWCRWDQTELMPNKLHENFLCSLFKLPISAPEFIMETRNEETLKQKQVLISIFTVICIILTTRTPGQNKRGFGGIDFIFLLVFCALIQIIIISIIYIACSFGLTCVMSWYCQFGNLTLVAALGMRSSCSQQGKAGGAENTSDGFPHILEINTRTQESKLRWSKCSSASNNRHNFFSLRIKAMLL